MRTRWPVLLMSVAVLALATAGLRAADPPHPLLAWVKRHPAETPAGKPSPRLGYETTYGYDPVSRLLIRYSGHNQGGGGEQNSETWTYDLDRDAWTLIEPNDVAPGICCGQQNVFDEAAGRFIRFPSFSGNHGWQSFREIRLKDSSVWTFDPATNLWRNLRPYPAPFPHGLRGAAWDRHTGVTVVFAGEVSNYGTIVYDLYANTWQEMKPRPEPESNVSQPGFTYDAVNQVFVHFGSQFAASDKTWLYDLRKNLWRVLETPEHPPAGKSCPVLAADTRNGIVLASLQGPDRQHQTWALDVAKATWTRLKVEREPDPSGDRNRVILYLPDRNLFVLENNTSGGDRGKREQQVWTFRYAEAPVPPTPAELRVTTAAGAAALAWKAPEGTKAASWNVYRGEAAKPWEANLEPVAKAVKGMTYGDSGLKEGGLYFYQVRPVDEAGKEGPPSRLARTQPPVVQELTVAVPGAKRVEIAWEKAAAEDVVGYIVERADVAVYSSDQVKRIRDRYRPVSDTAVGSIRTIGAFQPLTPKPVTDLRYVDETVDLAAGPREPAEPLVEDRPLHAEQAYAAGKPYPLAVYAYRIVAVNRLGTRGGPSPTRFTYPSAVQYVFSKEDGAEATRLKWRANPEKGIRGYLVYRHDGAYDKHPILRLTPEPITATEFTDPASGKGTRRYEVVAVDALGQEGEPSQPVWSRREWAKYYEPYAGEWHQ